MMRFIRCLLAHRDTSIEILRIPSYAQGTDSRNLAERRMALEERQADARAKLIAEGRQIDRAK